MRAPHPIAQNSTIFLPRSLHIEQITSILHQILLVSQLDIESVITVYGFRRKLRFTGLYSTLWKPRRIPLRFTVYGLRFTVFVVSNSDSRKFNFIPQNTPPRCPSWLLILEDSLAGLLHIVFCLESGLSLPQALCQRTSEEHIVLEPFICLPLLRIPLLVTAFAKNSLGRYTRWLKGVEKLVQGIGQDLDSTFVDFGELLRLSRLCYSVYSSLSRNPS